MPYTDRGIECRAAPELPLVDDSWESNRSIQGNSDQGLNEIGADAESLDQDIHLDVNENFSEEPKAFRSRHTASIHEILGDTASEDDKLRFGPCVHNHVSRQETTEPENGSRRMISFASDTTGSKAPRSLTAAKRFWKKVCYKIARRNRSRDDSSRRDREIREPNNRRQHGIGLHRRPLTEMLDASLIDSSFV